MKSAERLTGCLKNKFFNAETQRREGKTSETVIQKIFDELPVP
jgi:hypothetical protein